MADLLEREQKLKKELKQLRDRMQREKEKECFKLLTSLAGTEDMDKVRRMVLHLQSAKQRSTDVNVNKSPVIHIDEDEFFNS